MPLTTPPFRTSLLTANGVPFATDNGDIQTTRDWWMYWNQLTDRSNSNSKLASEGSHADRPDPGSMPDGALYYENDRGVLYASTLGDWRYVAGTMWGTAGGPDQRPTDLDAADVGFDFRTNVSPAREFIWSGGRWIEVTPMLYGTHAQRIAGTIADLWAGMAWMETDRSNVIYQNQSGGWFYVAGTMTGLFANRPTDLGAADNGFRFESTDTKQSFRWSGSAWVETTGVGGAVNLTHPNVVTKVGSTQGQIVEGGITDESAANSDKIHITAAGNIGIGTPTPVTVLTLQAGSVGAFTPLLTLYAALAGTAGEGASIDWADGSSHTVFGRIRSLCRTAGQYDLAFSTYFGAPLEAMRLAANGGIVLSSLPSASPGPGSRQIWYDPADGNRVKFAP